MKPNLHKTKSETPNWKNRAYKTIVRRKITHEVKTLAAPKDLHCLHLPGETLQCIQAFEAAHLPVSTYYGLEKEQHILKKIEKNITNLPANLRKKIKVYQGEVNDILQTGNARLRHKTNATKGWDCLYLDFMCGFRQTTKNTICQLMTNPKTFAHAHSRGYPGLIYISFSYRGDTITKKDLELLQCLAGPDDENTPNIECKAFYHKQLLGIENYIQYQAIMEGLDIETTHKVVYKDQTPKERNPVIMLALGLKVFDYQKNKKKEQIPTLFLGIEKCSDDLITLQTLIQWQRSGILPSKEIPGHDFLKHIIKELTSLKYSAKEITQALQIAGRNITADTVQSLIDLP